MPNNLLNQQQKQAEKSYQNETKQINADYKKSIKEEFIMKTFLGFATGLLSGTLLGMACMAYVGLTSKSFREYLEKEANELNN